MNRIRIFLVVFVICLLTGCAAPEQDQEVKIEGNAGKGYVEQDVPLPFETDGEKVIGMVKNPEGKILIYTQETNTKKCNAYEMQADQSFKKTELSYLEAYLKEASAPWMVSIGGDGSEYFLYFDSDYYPHVIRAKDGQVEELAKENIKKYMEMDNKEYPSAVHGTADGKFVITYMGNFAECYDKDGKLTHELKLGSGDTNIRRDAALDGNSFIGSNQDKSGFILYDMETGKERNQIAAPDAAWRVITPGDGQNFYYMDEKGVQCVKVDGKLIETILDAADIPALLEKKFPDSFEMDDTDNIYILYKDSAGSSSLKYYSYGEVAKIDPSKGLKIIGLDKSDTVLRAVSEFEKKYPDIKIEFQSYGEVEKLGSLSEVIRMMNTEILSGASGPDLILLDGLPVDSYVEKGALTDLTGFYHELQGENEILENLQPTEGESVYFIPSRFSVPIMYGTKHAMEQISSIHNINAFLKNPGDTPLFDNVNYQILSACLLNLHYEEITEGLPEASGIQDYMDAVVNLGEYVGASKEVIENPEEYMGKHLLHLGEPSCLGLDKVGITELRELQDLAEPITFQAEYGQEISLIDGLYIPYDTMGINTMSEHQEEAKEFLRILLSPKMQQLNMGEGFPVNKKAFEALKAERWESAMSLGWEEEGQEVQLTCKNPEEKEVTAFKEMVKGINRPLTADINIYEMLLEGVARVYNGEATSEQSARDVAQKIKLYLAEAQ